MQNNIHYPSKSHVNNLNNMLLLNKIEAVTTNCLYTACHNYISGVVNGLSMEQISIIQGVVANGAIMTDDNAMQHLQHAFNNA